jgi:hypothetical protein
MLKPRKGQSYIEFVVVLPGILLLLFLAWELAYFWWGRMVVSTGTFEAARQVAVGQPPVKGYALYNDLLSTGLGSMGDQYRQGFTLTEQPALRSVSARASVPWRWPSGLGALMGGGLNLELKSSAFFRLEEFYPGPPETFE